MDRAIPESEPEYPYLVVDRKQLLEELSRSKIDLKKATWVPDDKDGFVMAEIESAKGDDVVVRTEKGDVKTFKKDQCQDPNPQKYEQATDMADLTQLNEASILHNLRQRYFHQHIYTYSGLFCVVINPYKFLPIYTESVIARYRGKRRTEVPPHLYAIADGAFSFMLQDRENQSILITGESGAGKTENTKKVIQYFAKVAAAQAAAEAAKTGVVDDSANKKGSLEDQIVQCNPPLEAYGNAKTVRNNNSSRFGKFIRIHFGPTGKIAGADIEHYLLEKSRVTACGRLERNYHIFYQLCSPGGKSYHDKLLLTPPDPGVYSFANQGVLTVDGIDDSLEMKATSEALDILGFTEDEKLSMFKSVAAICWMGEMKFKQSKDEQAEADGTTEAEKAAFLLGINAIDLIKSLVKPKVKVGNEWVNKAQNKDQVTYAVATLSKSLYSRLFDWLVKRCNQTLDTKSRRQYFIGVLDIAGFEIFEFNSFEQLCINYTNERLQQFFNHHMFVLEQEEYKKEGIDWVFIDFGLDLAACIELIEKPMGILSILEEECIVPKGSDKTLVDKLNQNHLGKSPNYLKPAPSKNKEKGKEPHFELKHYAGSVAYNCNGWLERNKDPVNACTVELMSSSKDALIPILFPAEPQESGGGGKKKKGGAMQTISAAHRDSLNRLMKNLYSTHPHFVRCIIPNELKQSWYIDAALVLNQLKCNGVLEGIRICRKGFPNRMIYPDFKQRYTILAPNAVPAGFVDAKVVAEKVLGALSMGESDYRLGQTKVFFRAGILAKLEEWREEKLSAILAYFQAKVRGYLMRRRYKKLQDQRNALAMIQRNVRKYMDFKDWMWWKMYTLIKPLLAEIKSEDELAQQEEEFEKTKHELERMEKLNKELEEQNVTLLQQKNDLFISLQATQDQIGEMEEKVATLVTERQELEERNKEAEERNRDLEDRLQVEENRLAQTEAARQKLEDENGSLKDNVHQLEGSLAKAEQDKQAKDAQIRKLQDNLASLDQAFAKLTQEKKGLEENLRKLTADLQAEEEKGKQLTKAKQKLESDLSETVANLNREKKIRADVEKVNHKLEGDLKATQNAVTELQHIKEELEATIQKKDGDMTVMQGRLQESLSANAQLQKANKDLQHRIEELEWEVDAERTNRAKVEKQRSELDIELEDLRTLLDEANNAIAIQTDVSRRRDGELGKMRHELEEQRHMNEQALSALRKKSQDSVNDLNDALERANKSRQKVEQEKLKLKNEAEDLQGQLDSALKAKSVAEKAAKSNDEKWKHAHAEATRLADELVAEEEHSDKLERLRKQLEHEIMELQARVAAAESVAMKDGKRQLEKLEQRLRDVESELAAEQRAHQETAKTARRTEQRFKEVVLHAEEEQRSRDRLYDVIGELQQKLKSYKRQIEDAEEMAAANLVKYSKVQVELQESTELADVAQQLITKMRIQVSGTRATSSQR